jgi:hypothetical protein
MSFSRHHWLLFGIRLGVTVVLMCGLGKAVAPDEGESNSLNASASPVTINFDTLQTNVGLPANYYQSASFSSYSGATISTAYDCYNGWGGSCPNGIVASSGSGSILVV